MASCPCGPCCYCGCQLPLELERLYLHRNRISGSLPTELGAVELAVDPGLEPFLHGRTTSRLSGRIKHLHLNNNHLVGVLPSTLGNLTALQELRLAQNSISGTIPSSLRVNEQWLESYGIKGKGGAGVPSELGISQVRAGIGKLNIAYDLSLLPPSNQDDWTQVRYA